jgi:hypothetical protein
MTIVYLLCAAYVAYCLATNPAGAITTPDSIRYLEVWANYPLGYPLFLKIFGERGAIIAQPVIFGAALAFFGGEIVRLSRSAWLAAAVVIGCAVLPQIREFHASILSESLFISLVIVILGLSLRFTYHSTWRLIVLIAIAAGASATIRRTGFAFVPLMLIMVLMQRHRLIGSQPALFGVAALAPFLVIVGIEQAAAPIVHSGHPSSLTGRHMFAKAALIDAPAWPEGTIDRSLAGDDLVRFELNHHLESDYLPIRQFLASAPRDIRGVLSIYYETCLQGGCVDRSRALMPGVNEADQTKMLGAVAFSRIARAPGAFVDLWALNYMSLWSVDRLHHPDRAARLNAFIAAHRPMPFEQLAFSLEPNQPFTFEPVTRVRYVQWMITALAVWTALLAAVGIAAVIRPSRFPPLLVFASVAALAAHGGLLLTSLLAAGFSRFTIGVWPAIVTAAITGLYWGAMLARPFRKTNF